MKELHDSIVARFKETLGGEHTTVVMLQEADRVTTECIPEFTAHHLVYIRALVATYQTEMPITEGFSQDQLMEYAQRIGRYNGMLDILTYLESIMDNQLNPQQE